MFGKLKSGAFVRSVLCVLLICTGASGALAQDVLAIFEAGGDNAMEADFDVDTGQRQGPGHQLQSGGSSLSFDGVGAVTFAPNDSLWGLIESGTGDAILAPFNPLTGQRLGGGGYLQSGGDTLSFSEVGAMSFAPDGTLWGVIESGAGQAILASFDAATGQRLSGGGYLQSVGSIFSFAEIGAMSFASDGTLWSVIESGAGDAIVAHFNPLTGQRLSGGAYLLSGGENIAFGDVGAIGFASGDAFWGLIEAGNGGAIFDQFSLDTGERLGVGSYLKIGGSTVPFKDVGAMTFRFAQADAVPEPAVWSLMLLGFAAVGANMRTRRMALA